ncbi:hypothetical protein BJ138DRAFT_1015906 [Hygrophoropsis aurantiaca]|uniref:Uncharacterized protein n=1 Tax=Hygrophoropsis aurantiaca TaxID=72124 RepID=A0ACB8A0G2_9AGAM|nr:hypothetical protein BJ138DRAFT_1015906 [Hygrophoropsis aurantiaca]
MVVPPLPQSFTSLYRLLLRTSSVSVLHKPSASRRLRALWRPTFEHAAQVIRTLQNGSENPGEQEQLQIWLRIWEQRMDNTLSLLATSAQSRGLPHQLTRNLSWLRKSHATWVKDRYYAHKPWKPQLPETSPEYERKPIVPKTSKAQDIQTKNRRFRLFDEKSWDAFGEVVRMAEGRHQISLGRIRLKRWSHDRI